ncbi:ubiquitin-specific protease doa4, partial [Kappamyces sp. JEL0680]
MKPTLSPTPPPVSKPIMSSSYRPQYMQPSINYKESPVIPPKPRPLQEPLQSTKPAAGALPINGQLNQLTLNEASRVSGPPMPPKPRPAPSQSSLDPGKLSPPLPPKPGKLDTRLVARGQHPFVLPTSPIGNKFGVSGLRNLGNTCFMNSVLQCLSATYPLARYFMDGSYRKHISRTNPLSSKGKVAESYASVIRSLWSAEESIVIPTDFKATIGELHPSFAGNEQQDSQEFLSFLLDQLHEDLNVAKRPFPPNGPELDSENYPPQQFMMMEWQKYKQRNWSIIVDMFQGVLQSVLQCLTCKKTSTSYNTFMYLSLPIPSTNRQGVKNGPVSVFECLQSFLATETLTGDDQWKCPRCKVNRDASKSLAIVKLPTVLLIHLKRFSFQGPFRDKLETP